jgi:exodeoxyribonuclease VII small subunit
MPLQKDLDKLSYEQAFHELQEIVKLLDDGLQPLEEILKLFERGQALAQHCERLLNQAQLQLQKLSVEKKPESGGKDA